MAKPLQRVQRWNKPNAYASVEEGATKGADLGVNLYLNGVLVRPEDVLNIYANPGESEQFPITYWRNLLEVPPNVTALANTATAGLYVVTGSGTSVTREIQETAGETVVTDGDGVAADPVIGLADVTPTTGGTLQKYGFDAKGRRSEAAAATTDDLSEGATNLYFSDQRAQDAVGAILTDTADIEWTYSPGSIEANLSVVVHAALADAASALQPGDNVSELVNDAGYVSDSPSDGIMRARMNGAWAQIREALTSPRTYYVSPTGNNSNDGLSPSSPLQTIQAAWSKVVVLDTRGNLVTIQLADGAYTTGLTANGPMVGGGVAIVGNPASPGNVIVSVTGANALVFGYGVNVSVNGLTLTAATAGSCLFVSNYATVTYQNVIFGSAPADHVFVGDYGRVTVAGNYEVVSGAVNHWHVTSNGRLICQNRTVTISGNPTFTRWVGVATGGGVESFGCTFSGAANGARFLVQRVAFINTEGSGANYFPGNAAGTASAATYGAYI